MRPIDVFHIGPQKTASTWIYRCLREHPELACPPQQDVYYFDMQFHRGRDWYASLYAGARGDQKLVDPTCTYIRCPWAPARMAQENPRAKIVLCMRDPVERAFSHYWHEKKRRRTEYEFAEVLSNYDLFSSWLEPGFYARHVERFLEHFPREQILCQRFDLLREDPSAFLRALLEFIEVDASSQPSVLHERLNVAGPRNDLVNRGLHKMRRALEASGLGGLVGRLDRVAPGFSGKAEYAQGPSPELEQRLREICEPEIERTEKLLGIDLSAWRRVREPPKHP